MFVNSILQVVCGEEELCAFCEVETGLVCCLQVCVTGTGIYIELHGAESFRS